MSEDLQYPNCGTKTKGQERVSPLKVETTSVQKEAFPCKIYNIGSSKYNAINSRLETSIQGCSRSHSLGWCRKMRCRGRPF